MLIEELQKLLEDFLSSTQTDVDDGHNYYFSYDSPDDMEACFKEWIEELVSQFTDGLDWEDLYVEHQQNVTELEASNAAKNVRFVR